MAVNDTQQSVFKSFPQFSRLRMEDKVKYNSFVQDYPPISDITFASLMTWWNDLDSCSISLLNSNLVISYWLPGDEHHSGISLIGDNMTDQSICEIFDYQKSQHIRPRLVHVPEFVVTSLTYPELFIFEEEQDYNEGIYAVSDMSPLESAKGLLQTRAQKFLARHPSAKIVTKSIDLNIERNQRTLIKCVERWAGRGTINDISQQDSEAVRAAIINSHVLDIQNMCIYVDGRIVGFQLYQIPADKTYVIGTFIKLDPTVLHLTEYLFHAFAGWLAERGFSYINYEQDLGLAHIRAQKLALRPVNFFRKYTIKPLET